MKQHAAVAFLIFLFVISWPAAVRGQARVPDFGSTAVGGEIGLLFPADESLETGLVLDGLYEYYVTPRVGIRGMVGWSDPEFERVGNRSLRQIRLTAGVNYNWERGVWHPFVGAGVGAFFIQEKLEDAEDPDSATKGGFHLDAGLEYFARRDVTLKGEIRYQTVADDDRGNDPSGLILTIGLKRYF